MTSTLTSEDSSEPNAPLPRRPNSRLVVWAIFLCMFALCLAVVIMLILHFNHRPPPKSWTRVDPAYSIDLVQPADTLVAISDQHQLPAITLAMFNDRDLLIHYPNVCGRMTYDSYPRMNNAFCNDRMNLKEADTLMPHQQIRVPSALPPSMASDLFTSLKPADHVVVVFKGTGAHARENAEYAAVISEALQRRHQLADVWFYYDNGMFEFRDQSRAFEFDSRHYPTTAALTILSYQPSDVILLITDDAFPEPNRLNLKPVIGFCTTSVCENSMIRLTDLTRGTYVPYRG